MRSLIVVAILLIATAATSGAPQPSSDETAIPGRQSATLRNLDYWIAGILS